MNAAARTLEREYWFQGSLKRLPLSRELIGVIVLVCLMLISAFAVVYIKNVERHMFNELQLLEQERDAYEVEWGQLLLEQSTLATPSQVQTTALNNLGMVVPDPSRIVMIELG